MTTTERLATTRPVTVSDYKTWRNHYCASDSRPYAQLTPAQLAAEYQLTSRQLQKAHDDHESAVRNRPSYAPGATRWETSSAALAQAEEARLNLIAVTHNLKVTGKALPA